MSGDTSDKCYIYFDKLITIANYVISQYTGVQGENSLYFHNANLENGANDNSYRYAGSSDSVNNFVCFGTNTNPCPNDNLYRIIGVFGENYHGVSGEQLVKIIKATIATKELLGTDGTYASIMDNSYLWTKQKTCPTEVAYSDSSLLQLANKNIIAAPNPGDGTCTDWQYSDLNTINLNINYIEVIGTYWSKFIENSTWYTSNISSRELTAYEIFQEEIKNGTKKLNSKIGLMYVSDYGFAANPSKWTTSVVNYNNDQSINWLNNGISEWTITVLDTYILTIHNNGGISNVDGVDNYYNVRPTFYLSSSVLYKSGTGTISDPYILED